jgi:hypothetical protein
VCLTSSPSTFQLAISPFSANARPDHRGRVVVIKNHAKNI